MSQFRNKKSPVTPLPGIERHTDRLEREAYLQNLIATMEKRDDYQDIGDGPLRTKFIDRKDRTPIERVNAAICSHIRQRPDKALPTKIFVCLELARLLVADICSLSVDGFTGKYPFPDWNGGIHEMVLGLDHMIDERLDVNTVVCVYK
ncbi:MAG TPA: hypothetical protein VHV10_02525 [Ktedonobacteraceae bacterium]|jgi:hypothetical protein|nr:hypothetical protein [Ktedonobacteraceae bacterium]